MRLSPSLESLAGAIRAIEGICVPEFIGNGVRVYQSGPISTRARQLLTEWSV
jgi:hypothetical protein